MFCFSAKLTQHAQLGVNVDQAHKASAFWEDGLVRNALLVGFRYAADLLYATVH